MLNHFRKKQSLKQRCDLLILFHKEEWPEQSPTITLI